MLEFFKIADAQVDEKIAKQNGYVAEFRAEIADLVNEKLAKLPGCIAAWKARNAYLAEVNSHQYLNGLGTAEPFITSLMRMHDPIAVTNMGKDEWENISYSDINDGCGLERWGVDPTRAACKRTSIISKLKAVDITDQILRDIEAAKWAFKEDAELFRRIGPQPTVMEIPAAPMSSEPQKVVVNSDYSPLRK